MFGRHHNAYVPLFARIVIHGKVADVYQYAIDVIADTTTSLRKNAKAGTMPHIRPAPISFPKKKK